MTRQRGRRPGDPGATRRAIEEAARATFAEVGYERATIRAIAADAGVDPALVHHHFGSKEDLFVATHDFPISPASLVSQLDDPGDGSTLGERVARAYLRAVLRNGTPIEALVRGAVSNETARAMLREFIEQGLLKAVEARLDVPDARYRMTLAAAQVVGVVMLRRIVGIRPLADAELEDLVRAVGPTIDRYLDPTVPVRAEQGSDDPGIDRLP